MRVRLLVVLASGGAALWASATEARANDHHTCDRVAPDYFELDGMLDDWTELRPERVGGRGDGSFELRCAYDAKALFLSVNVRDIELVRTGRARGRREDNALVELKMGKRGKVVRLRVFPGKAGVKPARTWNGRRAPRWLEVEDSLQKDGYSFEAAIPFGKVPGFGKGSPQVSARVTVTDSDRRGRPGRRSGRFAGRLSKSEVIGARRAFMEQARLTWRRVGLDDLADVDGDGEAERVIAGGKVVGVLGTAYHFFGLPVGAASDVERVRLIDFEGRGRSYIVAEFTQRGEGFSRDVVGIWRFAGAGFQRVFAFEVRTQLGERVVENQWSLVPRGKHRPRKHRKGAGKRGHDILIEATGSTGWDGVSYPERANNDVTSILLPWEDRKTAVYWIDRGSIFGGEPKVGR